MRTCIWDLSFAIKFSWVLMTAVACGGRTADEGGAGGAAATGGTSSTGGAGGTTSGGSGGTTGGNGGTGTGGNGGFTPGDSGVCGCVASHIGWGMNGGNALYQDSSALEVCNEYVHQRVPRAPDPPGMSCQQPITDCVGRFGPEDVMRALTNADVKAALAAAPVLYGEDPRSYDGTVMRLEIGAAIIEVGNACKLANCKPIPAGVSALVELLQAIDKQELKRAPCSMIFPQAP